MIVDRETAPQRPIDIALGHHQMRPNRASEAIYRELVDANPDDDDALHLLGVTAIQRRRFDEAVALISR